MNGFQDKLKRNKNLYHRACHFLLCKLLFVKINDQCIMTEENEYDMNTYWLIIPDFIRAGVIVFSPLILGSILIIELLRTLTYFESNQDWISLFLVVGAILFIILSMNPTWNEFTAVFKSIINDPINFIHQLLLLGGSIFVNSFLYDFKTIVNPWNKNWVDFILFLIILAGFEGGWNFCLYLYKKVFSSHINAYDDGKSFHKIRNLLVPLRESSKNKQFPKNRKVNLAEFLSDSRITKHSKDEDSPLQNKGMIYLEERRITQNSTKNEIDSEKNI
jgi:hypothetical protein